MKNWKTKFRQFLAGRNGTDAIGWAVFVLYFLVWILQSFFPSVAWTFIGYALLLYAIFRMFSRNLVGRRAENAWFLRGISRIKSFFQRLFSTIGSWFRRKKAPPVKTVRRKTVPEPKSKTPETDKDHAMVPCPICAHSLRVRRTKGERFVLCPACHNEVKVRI